MLYNHVNQHFMKKLLLFIFPITLFAQTQYTQNDILNEASHSEQWLLTNTVSDQMNYAYGVSELAQSFIFSKTKWKAKYSKCGAKCEQWVHESNVPSDLKKRNISYKLYYDYLPNGGRISKKVVFEGSKDLVIDFFMSYWTEDLEFVKFPKGKSYVASARFLSDLATLEYTKEGDAIIVVTTVEDLFNNNKISSND